MLGYCPTCHDVMSSTALDFHRSQHDPLGRPFKCNQGCVQYYFATFDERQHHLLLMHGIDDHDVKPEIPDVKSSVDQFNIKPPVIRERTTSSSNVNDMKPKSTHRSADPLTCPICERIINRSNMHFHMRLHDKTDRPHQCTLGCRSIYFKTKDALQDHNYKRHHHRVPTTTCKVCGFETTRNMKKHMVVHDPTRPFQCTDGCVQTFYLSRRALLQHLHDVHRTDVKPKQATTNPSVACTVCTKIVQKKNMNKHMKRHSSDGQPHECTHGCKSFFFGTTEALNRHVGLVHPQIKSLSLNHKEEHVTANTVSNETAACTVCGRTVKKPYMPQHMCLHNRVGRPFACESGCPSTFFKSRDDLGKHLRLVHKIYSKSKCTICDKAIVGTTERHMRLHDSTGRPFKCSSGCTRTFFESHKVLLKHNRQVHSVDDEDHNDLILCTVCGTELLTRNMKLHMVMHDNEKKMVDNNETFQQQLPELASTAPDVVSAAPTTADQRSDNKVKRKIPSVSRPVGKKIRFKTKVPVKRRSIIGTPTVQMQLKEEPFSPLPAKQARQDPRPPSPPVYDQPDDQGSANNNLKSPTIAVHKEDVTINSDSTGMLSVTPPSQTTLRSVDDCPDQDNSSVYSTSSDHDKKTSIKRRRQSHHHSETCPTTPNNVDDLDDNADVADRRVVDEKLTTVEQPDDKVGNKDQLNSPSLPMTNHVDDVAQTCRSSPPKLTNVEERQVQFEEHGSDSDTSVIVTAVKKNTNWLPSIPKNASPQIRSKLRVQNIKIEPNEGKSQSKLTTFFKIK